MERLENSFWQGTLVDCVCFSSWFLLDYLRGLIWWWYCPCFYFFNLKASLTETFCCTRNPLHYGCSWQMNDLSTLLDGVWYLSIIASSLLLLLSIYVTSLLILNQKCSHSRSITWQYKRDIFSKLINFKIHFLFLFIFNFLEMMVIEDRALHRLHPLQDTKNHPSPKFVIFCLFVFLASVGLTDLFKYETEKRISKYFKQFIPKIKLNSLSN